MSSLVPEFPPSALAALGFECVFLLAGMLLLWRRRAWNLLAGGDGNGPLPAWGGGVADIALFLFCVLTGSVLVQSLVMQAFGSHAHSEASRLVLGGAGFQLGMALGGAGYMASTRPGRALSLPRLGALGEGLATFLMCLPVVFLVGLVWGVVLHLFGVDPERQELVDLLRESNSPLLVGTLATLAILGAPLTEETIFRAGIFRFLKTRPSWFDVGLPALGVGVLGLFLYAALFLARGQFQSGILPAAGALLLLLLMFAAAKWGRAAPWLGSPLPRWAILLIPALLFAALHANLASFPQLCVLGIGFSLAYERSGNIAVPMLAHALFNLNTIALLLAGVDA